VPVTVGGGIGPAGFVVAQGTATNAFGTFQLAAGDGITISTGVGQFQIASYGTTAVSSLAPVQSVAGRVGAVQLQASDVTAGTFAMARIPTISYTALANVPATFAPQAHTHSTADITGFTGSFAAGNHTHDAAAITSGVFDLARIPTVGYTALSGVPATFAPQAHTHGTTDVVGLTASFSQVAHAHQYVQVLNGLTGTVSIAAGAGVTVSTASSSITISAGGGGGSSDVDGGDYTGTLVYDRTITITQQPTDQSAVSGAATISVTATASPAGTLTYQWQRYQSSAWANVTGATSASLALTGLTTSNNGDRYRCVISAQSAASVTSGEAVIGVNPTAPGVPTGLSAVRGDERVTLSWTAPSNGGATITDYVVQFQLGAGAWQTFSDGTSTATSVVVDGLTNGQAYTFRVAAINSLGTGSYATSEAVTPSGLLSVTVFNNDSDFATIYASGATAYISGGLARSTALPLINRSVNGSITVQSAGVLAYTMELYGETSEGEVTCGIGNNFFYGPRYAQGSFSVVAGQVLSFSGFLKSSRYSYESFSVALSLSTG
jgi:hypothetical protein